MRLIAWSLLVLAVAAGPASSASDPSQPASNGTAREAAPEAANKSKTAPGADVAPVGGDCRRWERRLPINPAARPSLHVGLKTYAQTLQLDDREVVLTFDDGPWPATTPAILDALRAACAHATFFLIGKRARAAPDLARREWDEGHTVGHHSDTHPTFTLRGFDEASAEQDIASGILSDEHAIYGEDARLPAHPHVPFFRFPGFADTPELLAYLDRHHFAVFGTDLWAADWVRMSPDHERKRVLRLLEDAPHHNGIILFHDNIASTAAMLPGLLRDLRQRNYKIVHLVYDPDAKPPALTPPVEGWTPESSETEQIISRLRVPIVPGAHRAGPSAGRPGPADSGPASDEGLDGVPP